LLFPTISISESDLGLGDVLGDENLWLILVTLDISVLGYKDLGNFRKDDMFSEASFLWISSNVIAEFLSDNKASLAFMADSEGVFRLILIISLLGL
jgi:hypothetical protein